MQQEDPRNIFYNQRRQYSEPQQDLQNQNRNAQNGQNAKNSGQSAQSGSDAAQTYEQKVEEMKRLAAKYEREGEGQLVKDIVNNVIEQKASGKLSNEQLLAFAKRISPLLNAEQRTRLNALVEQLLKL